MEKINIATEIHAPIDQVWKAYNTPDDIKNWNHATADWHCTFSENDLREEGAFKHRMEAKDGSFSFDFEGTYTAIKMHKQISYKMADDRKVDIYFMENGQKTKIDIHFDAEETNSINMQKQGWQSILNNFKTYTEKKYGKA